MTAVSYLLKHSEFPLLCNKNPRKLKFMNPKVPNSLRLTLHSTPHEDSPRQNLVKEDTSLSPRKI